MAGGWFSCLREWMFGSSRKSAAFWVFAVFALLVLGLVIPVSN